MRGDGCLVAEGTGSEGAGYTIQAGERGLFWARVKARGRQSHGSIPMAGENAILKTFGLLPALLKIGERGVKVPEEALPLVKEGRGFIERVARERGLQRGEEVAGLLDHYSVNLGRISGGSKVNIVPDLCELEVDIRIPLGGSPEEAEAQLKELLPTRFEYEVFNRASPSYTPPNNPLVQAASRVAAKLFGSRLPVVLMPATNDAHIIREALKIPAIALGPGRWEQFHATDESSETGDIVAFSKVYVALAFDYLRGLARS